MICCSRLSLRVELVFVCLVGSCFVFFFLFLFCFYLFGAPVFNHSTELKSIHPLPSGFSKRASLLYLVQKRPLKVWGGGSTLALDPPKSSLWTYQRANTDLQLQLSQSHLLLRQVAGREGQGTAAASPPGNRPPAPGLWHSAHQSHGLQSPSRTLPRPVRRSWGKEGTESEPPYTLRLLFQLQMGARRPLET